MDRKKETVVTSGKPVETPSRAPAGPPAAAVRSSKGGIGRRATPKAEAVSDQLRRGTGAYLAQRRRITALALGATGALGVVSLYQTGLLKRVPEPPLPLLDANKVDASGEAYALLSMPDAILGMLSSVSTAALATVGTKERFTARPWLPVAWLPRRRSTLPEASCSCSNRRRSTAASAPGVWPRASLRCSPLRPPSPRPGPPGPSFAGGELSGGHRGTRPVLSPAPPQQTRARGAGRCTGPAAAGVD